MRILFVTIEDITLHKGSSTHIKEKVSALRERGHHVTLLAGSQGEFEFGDFRSVGSCRNESGKVSYPLLGIVFLKLISEIFRNSGDADILYANGPVAALATVITKPFCRKAIIYEVTSLENEETRMKGNGIAVALTHRIFSLLQRIDARFSDKTIVITGRVKDYYRDRYKIPESRLKVLGVTTDPNKFRPIGEASVLEPVRNRLKISEDAFIVTFIGNLAHWQNFEMLLRSAGIIVKKNPRIRFLIVGEGTQRQWLQQEIARASLGSHILMTDPIPHSEVLLHINISDVCISLCRELASGYSPMKLFEYLACGKPVVATRVAGYEIVEKAKAGRLIENDDAEAFASAILTLAENGRLREEYGRNALEFARENFGWDRVISDIEATMEEIANITAPVGEKN